MFGTVLIANRGEIACRIVRACRQMGLRSVAVYSDADRDALHVRLADDAIRIGPPEASGSYLNVDAILAAVETSGADAVHPGYGFLSERVVLPHRLAAIGVGWIGPHADAIARMGSKRAAKELAREAGIACVPGYDGADQSDARLAAEAERIGYPVLVKASAGGGGRGMRHVDAPRELAGALADARAEARAAFGSAELLLERLVLRPRHLEVQLAGDKHGNLVHLFERECSVQRNYQKIFEEAPAPNLPAPVREKLYDAALRLGRVIGYDSLGTVEFILEEGTDEPWFLEMNTRLQVEHPVTELVTGIDLVEWQIRAAAGETLPMRQDEIVLSGSAIEARICAEEPDEGFRPAVGVVVRFDAPVDAGVRVDSGIATGSVVTPWYDSLLAKVVAHGADREVAARRLGSALDRLVLLGVPTNQALARAIVAQPAFQAGRLTTRFLEESFPGGWRPDPAAIDGPAGEIAAVAIRLADVGARAAGPGPWAAIGPFRLLEPSGKPATTHLSLSGPDGTRDLTVRGRADRFEVDGRQVSAVVDDRRVAVTIDTVASAFAWASVGPAIWLQSSSRSASWRVTASGASAHAKAAAEGSHVIAPMTGSVSSVEVARDQRVDKGQVCLVMESMKVLMRLVAPRAGRVSQVRCAAGETVSGDAVLIEIEAA